MKLNSVKPQHPLDHLYPAGRVGVIALSTDFNIEADLQQMYPSDVGFFTSRVKNVNPLTMENLSSMAKGICATADTILPGTKMDALIYACTSGTVAIGADKITELVHKVRPGVPVTNPITAAISAFQCMTAKKLSILTPYPEAVNREVAEYFVSRGYDVLNIAGFGFDNDTEMTFISPQDIVAQAIANCDPDADVMFISCTALRASHVLDEIETQLNIPVLSSNQVLAWHSLKLVNYSSAIPGFGSLLRKY